MQDLPGTRERDVERMPRRSTAARLLMAASLFLVLANPVSAQSRLNAAHVETIQRFIAAIDAQRPADAVDMMSVELNPDATAKREWVQHFSAIKSIRVMAIEPSALGVPAPCAQYKVKLEAHVAADPKAPMPFYGWDDNPNFRWIMLCPNQSGAWLIASFGTGP